MQLRLSKFQFTHPRGVRHVFPSIASSAIPVSIHAPTRGATSNVILSISNRDCFNSRTHAGCDTLTFASLDFLPPFQFTHPRGVRLKNIWEMDPDRGFNSRTHAGCDRLITNGNLTDVEFQFTHPRGVRLDGFVHSLPLYCFNSRTHAGCDIHIETITLTGFRFNSRTHAGCDAWAVGGIHEVFEFQFTHPRGVRRTLLGFLIINELSNIICEVNNFIPNFKYIFQYYWLLADFQ